MLLAPKYLSCDLPIYPPETVVAKRREIDNVAANTNGSTLVRGAFIDPGLRFKKVSIGNLLRKTDKELAIVSELCGATVLRHQWGLFPIRGGDGFAHFMPEDPLGIGMPIGHILVAEVDIVRNARKVTKGSETARQINQGLKSYHSRLFARHTLYDYLLPNQFLIGTTDQSSLPDNSLLAVDIEPRLN